MNIIKNIHIHLQLSPQTRSLEIQFFHQRVCWLFSFCVSAPNVPFLLGFGSLGLTGNVSPPFAGWPSVGFASRGRCRRAGYPQRGEGTRSLGQAHCPCQQGSLSQQRRLAPVPTLSLSRRRGKSNALRYHHQLTSVLPQRLWVLIQSELPFKLLILTPPLPWVPQPPGQTTAASYIYNLLPQCSSLAFSVSNT